jgi:hypothetical protein
VVVQKPNAPLWVFLVSSVIRRVVHPHGGLGAVVNAVVVISLLVWAIWELARGVNPFRRILGAVVAVASIAALVR